MAIQSISPTELKSRMDSGESFTVVDVRNPWELDISRLEFAQHMVLDELPQRMNEIPKDANVVLVCRSGGRSQMAGEFLSRQGWNPDQLYNLEGGILAWARQVDPSLPSSY